MRLHPHVKGRSCEGALDNVPSPSQSLCSVLAWIMQGELLLVRESGTGLQRYQNCEGKEVGLYQFCELSSGEARAACSKKAVSTRMDWAETYPAHRSAPPLRFNIHPQSTSGSGDGCEGFIIVFKQKNCARP